MKYLVVLAALLAACGNSGGGDQVDSNHADAPPQCPAPSMPLAAGMHKLFIDFDGVTLTLGDCDDATTNCSSLVSQASTPIPPFLDAQAGRDAHINTIMMMVQESLAPFSIDAVKTRPASGDYWMVTLGGTSDAITGTADLLFAVKSACDATNKHSIALVFEGTTASNTTDRAYSDTIAGAFGHLAGLVPNTRAGDCMCTGSTCTHSTACTWGTSALPMAGNACSRTMQNEQLLLMDSIGCR